jgi:hypothetical protein
MNIKGMLPALAVGISTGGAQASTKKKAAAGATASVSMSQIHIVISGKPVTDPDQVSEWAQSYKIP